jgi:hypothetical protein
MSNSESSKHYIQQFVGQKVAFLCCRYQYRGVLSQVLDDAVLLANATSVEVSGATASEAPQTEDAIGSTIMIKLDSIEIFYQPNWCYAPLPGE